MKGMESYEIVTDYGRLRRINNQVQCGMQGKILEQKKNGSGKTGEIQIVSMLISWVCSLSYGYVRC